MKYRTRRFGIGRKMYIFVLATVLFAVASISVIAYLISVNQIDAYYKRFTLNTAESWATDVDSEFLKKLRAVAESDEYQELRDKAEEAEDDSTVIEYLKEKGLWDEYYALREDMVRYVADMDDIEYLYIIVWVDKDQQADMYLIDADDLPLYQTGYYEEREPEFDDADPSNPVEPVISNGDWGWICSGYAPVKDSEGNLICNIGCDINMEDVIKERRTYLISLIAGSAGVIAIIFIIAMLFVKRTVVKPLNMMTREMKKFNPKAGKGYEASGVINLDIENRADEIGDICTEIRSMQENIIDHIDNITTMERDKRKAETDAMIKDKEIGKISKEAFKDSLTGVGNKSAYIRLMEELTAGIRLGKTEFAIVMADANGLKSINDNYGHSAGDAYLRGCCRVICDVFKHSPVFRIGGDEFVVTLTGEDFVLREERVKVLRELFEKYYSQTKKDAWFRYSASIGMAEYQKGDQKADEVFKRADQAMYDAKMEFKKKNGIAKDSRM